MTTAQVVETSVTVNSNSLIQDYVHPDDQTQPTFEMTPGFKPFTVSHHIFNRDKTYQSYAFQKWKNKYIKKVINGKQYPYENMELTEDDRYDHDGYYRWLQAGGAIIKSPPNKIREAYKIT